MSFKIGNTNIGELYKGSVRIAEAYLGSILVYQLPAPGNDSYKIRLRWNSNDNFNMAGLHIDGVQPSTTDVTLQYHDNGTWKTAADSTLETAIQWDNNDGGQGFYCDEIRIEFTNANVPSTVQVKTGKWYGGGSMNVTMHLYSVKDGVETDLGYTSGTNTNNKTYTISL